MTSPPQLRGTISSIASLAHLLLESGLRPDQAELAQLIVKTCDEVLATQAAAGLRLLLAEDDEANQLVDQTLLARMGHSVDAVADGQKALERVGLVTYDAVIVDCQMPFVDGFEVARRIRAGLATGCDPRIPIIALTAYTNRSARERCTAAGMDDCLSKPLRPEEMAASLGRCLRRSPTAHHSGTATPTTNRVLDTAQVASLREAPGKNGKGLLTDFVALFYRDEPGRIADLPGLADRRDGPELARLAHGVAGSCAMLGARELQQDALALERAAQAKRWDEVPVRLEAVAAAWGRLKAALAAEGYPPPQ